MDKKTAAPERASEIFIYSNSGRQEMSGIAVQPYTGVKWRFFDALDFLKQYEKCLNAVGRPQNSVRFRTFGEAGVQEETCGVNSVEFEAGERKPELIVKTWLRQNASWQGSVTRTKDGAAKTFKSELELLRLMSSAMLKDTDNGWG